MAQVNFYSKSSLPTGADLDENGVYFIQGGELYKGSQRFGLGRVTVDAAFVPSTSSKDGQAKGDIVVTGAGAGWVFDGEAWQSIGGDTSSLQSLWRSDIKTWTAGLVSTAQGDGTYIKQITKDGDGKVSAVVSTFATDVQTAVGNGTATSTSNDVTVSVTTTSGKVTAVSVTAPAAKTWTAVNVGDANSYIYNVTQGTDGQVSASAAAFPTLATGTADGTVKLGSTDAKVSGWDALVGSVSDNATAIGGLSTKVSTLETKVSGIEGIVDVSNSKVTATTGSFTNLTVSDTATFSATVVSANTLTVGGTPVNNVSASSATDNDAGVAVTISTLGGGVSSIDVAVTGNLATFANKTVVNTVGPSSGEGAASNDNIATEKAVRDAIASLDNVMHFKGVVASTGAVTNPEVGDIVVIGSQPATGFKTGQEYIYANTSTWEIIGDQSAVTGGTSTSTVNAVSVTVFTAAATAFPSVTLAGIGTAAAKNAADAITANAATLPTCSAVASYVSTQLSYAHGTEVVTSQAQTLDAAMHAVAGAVDTLNTRTGAYVGGTSSSTHNGVSAEVGINSSTMAPTVTMTVDVSTLQNALGLGAAASKGVADEVTAAGTDLPTASVVHSFVTTLISSLDATVSTTTADNVNVTITEVDGKLTAVTATFDWITDPVPTP